MSRLYFETSAVHQISQPSTQAYISSDMIGHRIQYHDSAHVSAMCKSAIHSLSSGPLASHAGAAKIKEIKRL